MSIFSLLKDSRFFKIINSIDIPDERINKVFRESLIYKFLSMVFVFIQKFMGNIFENSFIAKNIDNFILFTIFLLFICSLFFQSNVLGILVIISFGMFLFKRIFLEKESFSLNSFDIAIISFVLITGLSMCFSSYFIPAFKGYIKVLVYFMAYLTFFNLFKNNPKRILFIIFLITVLTTIESIYGIFQYVNGVNPLATWQDVSGLNPEQIMTRVYGTLQPLNPNLFAGYLLAGLSFAFTSFFILLSRKNIRLSFYTFIALVLTLVTVILTGSRGAYLAVVVMVMGLIMASGHLIWNDYKKNNKLKKIWILCIMLGLLAVVFLISSKPAIMHRIESIFVFREDSSNSFRFNVYLSGIKMFLDNWIIGIGPGNVVFRLVYGLYMKTGFDALSAYNVLLEIGIETGIFGLLAFLWIIILSFIKGIKTIYKDVSIEAKIIVSGCLIGISGLMVHGLFDTIFFRPQINLLFWLMISILVAVTTCSLYLKRK